MHAAWRAPHEDAGVLVDPPPGEWPAVIAENQRRLNRSDAQLPGGSLAELRTAARRELTASAADYTSSFAAGGEPSQGPLVLTGHQPELFHAGVWAKNLLVGEATKRLGACVVDLVIDADLARGVALRSPAGDVAQPRTESIPLDRPAPASAYEERPLVDRETFAAVAARIEDCARKLAWRPWALDVWPTLVEQTASAGRLGAGLAQGRRRLEAEFGVQNLEILQSEVCRGRAFAAFTAAVLGEAARFRDIYNAALAAYRRRRRLRSHSHPAPDLARRGEWIEVPFWTWSTSDPTRRPLFVRTRGANIELSDLAAYRAELPSDTSSERLADRLHDLQRGAQKIRPRALATTAFARLLLCDLFVHGIGGGKYDEATDEIVAQFFGVQPPAFVVATATLRLPIERPDFDPAAGGRLRDELWRTTFHGERFVVDNGPAYEASLRLVAVKRRLLASPPTRGEAKAWRDELHRINAKLSEQLAPRQARLRRELADFERRRRGERILASREYSFVLHEVESLRRLQAAIQNLFPA